MRYRYYTVDVFTDMRFGGNPLAVLPDAAGLRSESMQKIAREFNYSETTFVLPPEDPVHDAKVRIFTPGAELPFAGHPNIGTAFVLANLGSAADGTTILHFEERAGVVPVQVRREGGRVTYCELTAPAPLELGERLAVGVLADALGLDESDLVVGEHSPLVASVGLPFLCVELAGTEALARSRIRADLLAGYVQDAGVGGCHLYTRTVSEPTIDIQCRMYAPMNGIPEDPATGSANCALAGLLAQQDERADATLELSIAQGVEMGRPSLLKATAIKRSGRVTEVRIGGGSVQFAEGWIEA